MTSSALMYPLQVIEIPRQKTVNSVHTYCNQSEMPFLHNLKEENMSWTSQFDTVGYEKLT